MKTRSTVLAIALAALVLSGCSTAKPAADPSTSSSTTVATTAPAATTAASADSELSYDLTSAKFGFSAKFPSKPTESTQDTDQEGQKVTLNSFMSSSEKNYYGLVVFSAACTPEGADIAARLKASAEGSINGAAKSAGDSSPKITSQKSTTVSGKPALESNFTISKDGQSAPISTVVVIDGSRFYSLLIINSTPETWKDFLSSFEITAHPAPSAACAPIGTK